MRLLIQIPFRFPIRPDVYRYGCDLIQQFDNCVDPWGNLYNKLKRIGVKSPTVADGIDSIQTVESAYVTAENHQLQETSMWIHLIHEYFKTMLKSILKKIASCFWKLPETIGKNPDSVLKFETQNSRTSHQKMELRHFETPFCNIQSEFSSIVHRILWSDLFFPCVLKNVPVC